MRFKNELLMLMGKRLEVSGNGEIELFKAELINEQDYNQHPVALNLCRHGNELPRDEHLLRHVAMQGAHLESVPMYFGGSADSEELTTERQSEGGTARAGSGAAGIRSGQIFV